MFAHNEYLQTFAELGAIGLALVLAALGALAVTARRAVDASGLLVGAVVSAFALTDFVWNIPLIPLAAALLLGLALRDISSPAASPAAP